MLYVISQVALGADGKSIPIAAIMGIICGCLVGFLLYRGGSLMRLHWFFVVSTCILYLVSAGLLSKAVGYFEQNAWNKVIGGESAEEAGSVIGYKVTTSVWHVRLEIDAPLYIHILPNFKPNFFFFAPIQLG